ncbi:MAG: hypothetical protein U5N10_03525 [Gemmobacter sp.]|nr:hypothetical protein [Gemmobacter sp.]
MGRNGGRAGCRAPRALIDAGDVVLVKGSKGIKVSLIVDALRKLGQAGRAKTTERRTDAVSG